MRFFDETLDKQSSCPGPPSSRSDESRARAYAGGLSSKRRPQPPERDFRPYPPSGHIAPRPNSVGYPRLLIHPGEPRKVLDHRTSVGSVSTRNRSIR